MNLTSIRDSKAAKDLKPGDKVVVKTAVGSATVTVTGAPFCDKKFWIVPTTEFDLMLTTDSVQVLIEVAP